jgi:hypothetical protein
LPPLPPRSFAAMKRVPLKNGANQVDLDADGRPDMVFEAWLENGNAHGYHSFSFFLLHKGHSDSELWHLLAFESPYAGSLGDSLRTSQGADCVLKDIRLLADPNARRPVTLIVGRRDFGESFADTAAVFFVRYELKRRTDGFGPQPLCFEAVEHIRARKKYCDVNEAFAAELALGTER